MAAVSNRSKAATRRSTWARFGESLETPNHHSNATGPLRLPVHDIYFELVLDASIREDLHRQQWEAVMANDRSTDLAIAAANDAKNEAREAARDAWRKFKEFGRDFGALPAAAQAA